MIEENYSSNNGNNKFEYVPVADLTYDDDIDGEVILTQKYKFIVKNLLNILNNINNFLTNLFIY